MDQLDYSVNEQGVGIIQNQYLFFHCISNTLMNSGTLGRSSYGRPTDNNIWMDKHVGHKTFHNYKFNPFAG